MAETGEWEVYALKYAERLERVRAQSFIFDDNHDAPHPIDFFVWLLRRGRQTILVDTGYDAVEAENRDRPIRRDPGDMLKALDLTPDQIDTLIVTHLHYDHAGGIKLFPKARLHLQASELAYAVSPCMCHDVLRQPYSADHICETIQRLYSGRVVLHEGDAEIADGVTVHRIGGHTRGLQAVRVRTRAGWLCLASDAAHYYENLWQRTPFPVVVDLQDMLDGFERLQTLASDRKLIVPGHDPLVRQAFPVEGPDYVFRLDGGPLAGFDVEAHSP